ncbi:MAG: hypothetical protein WA908_01665 [Pontixanthobacter sp.]
MTARPINLRHPTLGNIMSGRCTVLHRPFNTNRNTHALSTLQPGDALWIREPFHFFSRYNGMSLTTVDNLGGRAFFPVAPAGADDRDDWGPQRPARTLPKALHRHHLRIATIVEARLHDIKNAEIRDEGFRDRKVYAAEWNRIAATWGGLTYAANPTVLRIAFDYVPKPLPSEPYSSVA